MVAAANRTSRGPPRVDIRRETIGAYLKAAGIPVRSPGGWGRTAPKPANEVITEPTPAKPANANEVITDFGAAVPIQPFARVFPLLWVAFGLRVQLTET
jgi:hypothetical protein